MSVMRKANDFESFEVLVVGGRPHAVTLLRQIFDMLGIRRVQTIAHAEAAVECLRAQRYSAVFCEDRAGGVDVEEFVRAARRSDGLANPMVPIFLVCSGPRRRDVEAARDLGFNDVLTRPLSAATLLKKIKTATFYPRPFVAAGEFFGPDRRTVSRGWQGRERRKLGLLGEKTTILID